MRSDRYKDESRHGRTEGRHAKAELQSEGRRPGVLVRILLALVVVMFFSASGYAFYTFRTAEDSLDLSFTEDSPRLEFGCRYDPMDYVASHEGDVAPASELIPTGFIGEGTQVYTVYKDVLGGLLRPSKEFALSYSVADTEPPVRLRGGFSTTILTGETVDFDSSMQFADNADPEPKLTVSGDLDTDTAGEYPLHLAITDASGNALEWDVTVTVLDEYPEPEESGASEAEAAEEEEQEPPDFSEFRNIYAGDGRSFGIDVSSWQGKINFKKIKAAGCEFVMIRIGWSDGGKVTYDETFDYNLREAKAAGLRVGVYLYSYDNTAEAAAVSAAWINEKLAGESLDLPVAFDWEDFDSFRSYKMSLYQLNSMYDAFAEELKAGGYDCMLYGSKLRLEDSWYDTDIRPVWLAHYTDETDYSGSYMIWQQSCTGSIRGIKGDVDMDILFE